MKKTNNYYLDKNQYISALQGWEAEVDKLQTLIANSDSVKEIEQLKNKLNDFKYNHTFHYVPLTGRIIALQNKDKQIDEALKNQDILYVVDLISFRGVCNHDSNDFWNGRDEIMSGYEEVGREEIVTKLPSGNLISSADFNFIIKEIGESLINKIFAKGLEFFKNNN